MKTFISLRIGLPGVLALLTAVTLADTPQTRANLKAFATHPLSFEPASVRSGEGASFAARGLGYSVSVSPAETILVWPPAKVNAGSMPRQSSPLENGAVLKMKVERANSQARITGEEQRVGVANYFIGRDPEQWRTRVPTFAEIRCAQVYQDIDLIYHGNEGRLEFDFVVAPGADPREIALKFEGADKIELAENGDLVLHVATREIREHKPVIYQEENGARKSISGGYILKDKQEVRFQVAAYDRTKALVIDPTLSYSTYLGGSDYDNAYGIAVDAAGNIYVVGRAGSSDFPTQNAFQPSKGSNPGDPDVFVTKLNASGDLIYSTYLGSLHGGSEGYGIAVDTDGNAYVTGSAPANFPTTGSAIQSNPRGGAFITKLNPAGSALIYSVVLGGSGDDQGTGIALDAERNAFITGRTTSPNFPLTNPFQSTNGGGGALASCDGADAFVAKINADASALVYSTFLGGSGGENICGGRRFGGAIAVDAQGNAFVTGSTLSTNFPTTPDAFQPYAGGGGVEVNAFLTKISSMGALLYSSYLGRGVGYGVAVDLDANVYLTGVANYCDFPFRKQSIDGSGALSGVFVMKFAPDGKQLLYSTYLGGQGEGLGIAVDSSGRAYIAGRMDTAGHDYATFCPLQSIPGGGLDGFVAELAPDGASFVYSTYLGGSDIDYATAIALDSVGNAYVAGVTYSSDFPIANAFQPAHAGGIVDGFVAKIAGAPSCGNGPTFGPFTSWPPCSLTPPTITCPGNLVVNPPCGQNSLGVNFATPTAAGNCPLLSVTCNPASGSVFPVGTTTVTCTAADSCQHLSSCTFSVIVMPAAFHFTGFLAPISGADATGGSFGRPLRTFKMNSTIPVKFTAICDDSPVLRGVHTLQAIKYSDQTTAATPIDATPTDAATTGNEFRLTDGEWHFNLDTKATGMSMGIWLLRAKLSDGSSHSVWIEVK